MVDKMQFMQDLDTLGIGPSNPRYLAEDGSYAIRCGDILRREGEVLGITSEGATGIDIDAAKRLVDTPFAALAPDKLNEWKAIDNINGNLLDYMGENGFNVTHDAESTIGATSKLLMHEHFYNMMNDMNLMDGEVNSHFRVFDPDAANYFGYDENVTFSADDVLNYGLDKEDESDMMIGPPGGFVDKGVSPIVDEDVHETMLENDSSLLGALETLGIDVSGTDGKGFSDGLNMSASDVMYAEMDALGLVDENGGIDTKAFEELYNTPSESLDDHTREILAAADCVNFNLRENMEMAAPAVDDVQLLKHEWESQSTYMSLDDVNPQSSLRGMVDTANKLQEESAAGRDLSISIGAESVRHYELESWREDSGLGADIGSLDGLQSIATEHHQESVEASVLKSHSIQDPAVSEDGHLKRDDKVSDGTTLQEVNAKREQRLSGAMGRFGDVLNKSSDFGRTSSEPSLE